VIGVLHCMPLLGNVDLLYIIIFEFGLIGTMVLEPYETSRLHGLGNLYLMLY
jgi:hypothetical protein